ncbi:hypothetical protein B0H13DRAFT_2350653 [Mycena leptocephala]|nr:hypothetical protein B0H13DRAFT_2350653 [Mycena leptocephala]
MPPPTLANPPLAASDVGGPTLNEAGVHKKSDAGDFSSAVPPHIDDTENTVRVRDTAVSFLPSTTLVFLVLLPSASLNPGFSRTVQDFSRTCQFVLCPSTHPPPPSCCLPTLSGHHTTFLECSLDFSHPILTSTTLSRPRDEYHRCIWMQFAAGTRRLTIFSHNSKKAKFLVFRSTHPYANEGWGSCYAVACVDDADIALYCTGAITAADLKARIEWKVGHTNDPERRQREYEKCNVGQTHIWICRWESVSCISSNFAMAESAYSEVVSAEFAIANM